MEKAAHEKMSLLEVRNLTKRFGGLTALKDVSFSLEKGEILGVIGPNGSGKTTLFNVITGFYKPDAGIIKFKGTNIVGWRPNKLCRQGIGRTFQLVKPFGSMTALQNVKVGATFSGRVKESSLDDYCQDLLKISGLYTVKDAPVTTLTLAHRKRLELVRAWATNPELLLLDEVLAGLNPTEVAEGLDLIRSIAKNNITIIMVEHVMQAIMEISSRIVVLNFGEKIADGKSIEIANEPNVIEAYIGKS